MSHDLYDAKSDVKWWNALGCLRQYTVPNTEYTGGAFPPINGESIKKNTPSPVVRGGRSLAGIRRRITTPDASKWSPDSHHPTRGVFLLYRTYLWNKQQVMSINLTTWSTMQHHVVVDHVVFYVIHSQVWYNSASSVTFAVHFRCSLLLSLLLLTFVAGSCHSESLT